MESPPSKQSSSAAVAPVACDDQPASGDHVRSNDGRHSFDERRASLTNFKESLSTIPPATIEDRVRRLGGCAFWGVVGVSGLCPAAVPSQGQRGWQWIFCAGWWVLLQTPLVPSRGGEPHPTLETKALQTSRP